MKDNTLYNINQKLLDLDENKKELISSFIELIKQYK